MEIKVRELTDVQEKSVQEVEQELLDKHDAQQELKFDDTNEKESKETPKAEEAEVKTEEVKDTVSEENSEPTEKDSELSEEDVLSFIGDRYGKKINSIDELVTAREEAPEMPEDIAAYFKYKKETGRSIEDFVKLQRDFSDANPETLVREYLTITEEGLDPEDIDSLMEDYAYDEELDDESVVKKTKLAKKKVIAKAKRFF
eukprot:SAG25_NODE_440_length_7983_cov_3.822425_8_plen_201_part_00